MPPVVAYAADMKQRTEWPVGLTIHYRCVEGYLIVGHDAVECLNSLHWTSPPTCQSEQLLE